MSVIASLPGLGSCVLPMPPYSVSFGFPTSLCPVAQLFLEARARVLSPPPCSVLTKVPALLAGSISISNAQTWAE